MWNDYYLKFQDKAAYDAVAADFVKPAEYGAIDVIGPLYNAVSGEVNTAFHVNVRLNEAEDLPASLAGYVIEAPAMPKRVFMGVVI